MLKNFCVVLALAMVLPCQNMAQDYWQRVDPPNKATCLAFSLKGFVLEGGADGWFYRSSNNGEAWVRLGGLKVGTPYGVALHGSQYVYAAHSLTGNGSLSRSLDDGLTWEYVLKGLETLPAYCLLVNARGHVLVGTIDGIIRSTDNGVTWVRRSLSVSTKGLAADTRGYIFACSDDGMYRSGDNGDHWVLLPGPGPIPNIPRVDAVALAPSGDVFAVLAGNMCRSTDGGDNWTYADGGLPFPPPDFVSLATNTIGHVFAAVSPAQVFRTTDNGANWTEIPAAYKMDRISALSINADGFLWAVTAGSLFRTVESTTLPPMIETHPVDQWALPGVMVEFTASARGTPPLLVQWQFSVDGGITWNNVSDATGLSLTFEAAEAVSGNMYRALFTNPCGTAATSAALFLTPLGSTLRMTNTVENLVVGGLLDAGQGRGLQAILGVAGSNIQSGNFDAACRTLDAFCRRIEILVQHGGIPVAEGTSLIAGAEQAMGALGCGLAKAGSEPGNKTESRATPTTYGLSQSFPNPFNPSTTITYGISERSLVRLTVYNALGQEVATLVNGERDAGYHEVRFEAGELPTGVYFYRLTAGAFTETRRMLLLR